MKKLVLAPVIAAIAAVSLQADTVPVSGLVNYETPHVHPIDLTPDGTTLLAVNTAAHRLEIFTLSNGTPTYRASVPVGLDPISVRARTNTEAWVVNQVSDSVSIVALDQLTVTRTLKTDNEPADVIFGGTTPRAFVSCSDANSVNVFTLSNLSAAPQKVAIAGEEPRALAVSADGKKVFTAIFESGNATTVLNGRAGDGINVVSRTDGPYAGKNPPPNNGTTFNPPIAAALGTPPPVSLIVRKNSLNKWMDDNAHDWTVFVSGALATASGRLQGWDLADNDVAVIDADALSVTYQRGLMNLCMAIGVNPATGSVSVVGTDALNDVRYEPVLNGRFLRVNMASFPAGGTATVRDLNPHLNYASSSVSADLRQQSIGDPRGIAWRADGSTALVTGMGSNNVVVVNAAGARLGQIPVGEGPTGIVLHENTSRGYVMNKFSGSISVIDLASAQELQKVAFFDPTPAVIKAGRALLYDTHATSGSGHVSCGSCHVDGRTDRLAWDLGNPAGTLTAVPNASNTNGAPTGTTVNVSAMKGPMLTQTLQDIMKHPRLHWRGDKGTLNDFSGAFVSLLGMSQAPTTAQMNAFGAFLGTIHLPPNPYRNVDDSRPATVVLPDGTSVTTATFQALRGQNSRSNNCLQCHLNGGTRNRAANQELGQAFIAPAFTPFYKRLGYLPKNATKSTSGFGFFHDGSDSVNRAARTNTAETQPDMLAELMTLEGPTGPLTGGEKRQDTHAGVGRQITVSGAATAQQTTDINQLVSISSASPYAALIAKARIGTITRGYFHATGTTFQSDKAAETRTLADLMATAAGGQPVTFTLVAQGTERRLGVDTDGDGTFDGDEAVLTITPPGPQTGKVGIAVDLTLTSNNPNNGTLAFSATGLPQGLEIAPATGRITGIPSFAGTYQVTANVTDGLGGSAFAGFAWTIDSNNRAPQITQPATQSSVRGQTATLAIQALDPDGQSLTYSATGLPSGLGISPSTGVITGTVDTGAAASNTVTVTVSDGALAANAAFSWNTVAPATNRPPVINGPGNPVNFRGDAVTLAIQASDPDGQTVTFSATGLPSGLTISPTTGVVSGTVSATAASTNAVTVTASDGALSASTGFTWTVNTPSGPVAGLKGEYFSGDNFGTLVTTRIDSQISAYWPETSSPAAGVPGDHFSVRWTGRIQPQFSESYRFYANCDDGVRIYVNGQLILNQWNPTPATYFGLQSSAIALQAGQLYDLKVEFQDFFSDAWIELLWSSASQPLEIVPASRLFQPSNGGTDTTRPTVTLSGAPATATGAFPIVATFSESVTGVALDDFIVTNGTASALTGSGATYGCTITPASAGTVGIQLRDSGAADAAGNGNIVSNTLAVTYAPGTQPQPGLRGSYYAGATFQTLVTSRIDPAIDFYWPETSAPASGVPGDNFSVRWTGRVQPRYSETYRFHANCDDGVRITVNGQTILNLWNPVPATYFDQTSSAIALQAGQLYDITVELQDFYSDAWIQLFWSSPSQAKELVPASRLFQPATGAPVLANPGAQSTMQSQVVSLPITVSDPDGQTVTLQASGLPPGLSLNASQTIVGAGTTPGSYPVTLTASDGALTSTQTFTWTITARPQGLKATYFNGTAFNTEVLQRNDANVNFAWGTGSPASGVNADNFSVRWLGCVVPEFSETYTFELFADNGVRLWINDSLIVDRWTDAGPVTNTGTVTLSANTPAMLKLEYYEATGSALCELRWSSASRSREIVPQSRFLWNEQGSATRFAISAAEDAAAASTTIPATRRLALASVTETGRSQKMQRAAAGTVAFSFTVPSGTAAYNTVETSENLSLWNPWTGITTVTPNGNGTDTVQLIAPTQATAENDGSTPGLFFRVHVQ